MTSARSVDPRHLLVAALVWVLGLPLLGLAAVALRLTRAHDAVEALPADQRAAFLAAAIESALSATAVTSVLSALGIPPLIVLLARRRRPG